MTTDEQIQKLMNRIETLESVVCQILSPRIQMLDNMVETLQAQVRDAQARRNGAAAGLPAMSMLKCERCAHTWVPRKTERINCPKCKSPYWNIPRKRAVDVAPVK